MRRREMKKLLVVLIAVMAITGLVVPAFGGDKLLVKDNATPTPNTVFVVTDQYNVANQGTVGIGIAAPVATLHVDGTQKPQFIVSNAAGNARMDFLRGSASGVSQLLFGSGVAPSQTLDFQMGMFNDSNFQMRVTGQPGKGITITPAGRVGVGTTAPAHAFQVCGTAGCSYNEGGTTWVNASSREYKDNIQTLSADAAMDTLKNLNPVTFTYKTMPEQGHVGFIAEDVPDLVAVRDRKGLSALDIVAVLTKVVQEQNKTIEALSA